MNLTDLRTQLEAHATEVDDHNTDLVAGAHRKIRRTKQRRIAGALGGTAVVALLVAGLLIPGLTSTGTPDPAAPPPADYTKDGITFNGLVGQDRLDKAWIGNPGEGPLDFTWTPTTDNVTLRSICRSTSSTAKSLRVWVNDRRITDLDCITGTNADGVTSQRLNPTDPLWLEAPIGKPARVKVSIIDQATGREGDSAAQLAVGFYNAPIPTLSEGLQAPTRIPAAAPGDQSKDGIRFRSKVGGNTLGAASIGDLGQGSVQLKFTPTGAPLLFSTFCTANNGEYENPPYEIVVRIGNSVERHSSCRADTTDAGTGFEGSISWPASTEPVVATATLVNKQGRPVTVKDARIAFGLYFQGAQRVVTAADGSSVSVDEVIETDGYNYKLADLKTADAATTRKFSINIPTDKPFVFGAGSTSLGTTKVVTGDVTGVTGMYMSMDPTMPGSVDSFGFGRTAQAAGQPSEQAGTATFELQEGRPTKGKFILAVYLPVE
jgi:hypothetical protein